MLIFDNTFEDATHLHVACPSIEIEMEIFDFEILRKRVHGVLLCRFFMDIRNQDYPSLDGYSAPNPMRFALK